MTTIAMTNFARRHTMASPFSSVEGDDFDFLARQVEAHFDEGTDLAKGVRSVRIPAANIYTATVNVTPETEVIGKYEQRRPTEPKRFSLNAKNGVKLPATTVDVILYSHAHLGDDAATDADWEIVSLNANNDQEAAPIDLFTLLYNEFGYEGGTAVGYSDEELVKKIRESFAYMHRKLQLG